MSTPDIQTLSIQKCKPCEKGSKPFSKGKAIDFVRQVRGWRLSRDGRSILHEYVMKDFRAAIELIRAIAEIAEAEDHHPDVHLTAYRKLNIELATHSIGGLSENDFILAAKIDQLPKALKEPS